MWCVGAGSAQAGIDGVVLQALEPDNWAHLLARSPHPACAAPLESIRRASLELLSAYHPAGNPLLLPGDSASPQRCSSAKLEGDNAYPTSDVNLIAEKTTDGHTGVAVNGGSENNGALKADRRASRTVEGGKNRHDDDFSPSSACVLAGSKPLAATGAGTSDGVESFTAASRGARSPVDAAG